MCGRIVFFAALLVLPHCLHVRSERWSAPSMASAMTTLALLPLAIILLALLETVVAQNVEPRALRLLLPLPLPPLLPLPLPSPPPLVSP